MKGTLLAAVVLVFESISIFGQIPPNNLGQIVEVATPAGILPQPHVLIGWDSTGFVRQANSTDSFKVFGAYPYLSSLNGLSSLNAYNRFSAPTGNDSYEIHYGDSSYYWSGSTLSPNKLPFAVYGVGPRSSISPDTSVTHRLCIQRNAAGYLNVFGDMALPLDSTYWDMGTSSTIPFASNTAILRYFRTGKSSIPYTQTTWDPLTDSITPPPGTVIRLVAQTADSAAPTIAVADSVDFPNSTDTLAVDIYSFEPATISLLSAPDNMTIDAAGTVRWNYTASQAGHYYMVIVRAENSLGVSFRSFSAMAGYDPQYVPAFVRLRNNNLDFWTANNGTIAANAPAINSGLHFNSPFVDLIYAGGLYVGTKKRSTNGFPDTATVSDVEFDTEFQPGRILNSGDLGTLTAENPNDPALGVYLLPDHTAHWPSEAPHDVLGNPLKLSLRDSWTVFNDIGIQANPPWPFEEAPMLGLEIQRQTFMFSAYPWNNAVLARMRIINKSNRTYDSSFVSLWQDPDVGTISGQDLAAVDSALSLVYGYNSPGQDGGPVASGALLLQGPLDYAGTPDTAVTIDIDAYGFVLRIRTSRTMRMASAAIAYRNGNGDPGSLEEDITRYHYMLGLGYDGNSKPGGPFDMFLGPYPGDQRTVLSSGPFTFAAGDTQDIWYAYIGAIGANDSAAVDTLKHYAALMHQTFQNNMNDIVVGVSDRNQRALIRDFRLYSNYPNPFNPSTTIKYVLPKNSKVSLKVYNVLGQEVRALVNSRQDFGEHSVVWDGKNSLGRSVSSGIYLYRLQVDGQVKVKKMTVLK